MSLFIKNATEADQTWVGQTISPGEYYHVPSSHQVLWANDSEVLTEISNGRAVVAESSDGNKDITDINLAIDYLKGLQRKNKDGSLLVDWDIRRSVPNSAQKTVISHDFGVRETWYQRSIKETDLALSEISSTEFQAPSGKRNWINIRSYRLSFDHNLLLARDGSFTSESEYDVEVKVNGTVQDPSTYSIEYSTGKITFNNSQSGATVTATFYHNDPADSNVINPSEFLVKPRAGKKYLVEHVEVQFSQKTQFTDDIKLEVWAGGTLPDYGDFNSSLYEAGYGQERTEFRGPVDLINWYNNQYPAIPAPDGFTQDILVFPFKYLQPPEIRYQDGTVIMLKMKNDTPLSNCELGTITFYMEERNDD